jgi:catechol-2,3-dioxygenase
VEGAADHDLHIAREIEPPVLDEMLAKGKSRGIATCGISDRGFVRSIYFRDPNGYVLELTAKTPEHARMMDPVTNGARAILDRWQAEEVQIPASAG